MKISISDNVNAEEYFSSVFLSEKSGKIFEFMLLFFYRKRSTFEKKKLASIAAFSTLSDP